MCIFSSFTLKISLCSRVNSGAAGKWLILKGGGGGGISVSFESVGGGGSRL